MNPLLPSKPSDDVETPFTGSTATFKGHDDWTRWPLAVHEGWKKAVLLALAGSGATEHRSCPVREARPGFCRLA